MSTWTRLRSRRTSPLVGVALLVVVILCILASSSIREPGVLVVEAATATTATSTATVTPSNFLNHQGRAGNDVAITEGKAEGKKIKATKADNSRAARERRKRLYRAKDKLRRLHEREAQYKNLLGDEDKVHFDDIRRAGNWLLSHNHFDEAGAMFSSAMSMWTKAYKGDGLREMARELLADPKEEQAVAAKLFAKPSRAAELAFGDQQEVFKASAESAFIEFTNSCAFKTV